MSKESLRLPVLAELYQQYLVDQDTAAFVHRTTQRYTVATLARLIATADRSVRRAAVLSLGYLADYESNPVLGMALVDPDRGVRLLAETAVRAVWCRVGSRDAAAAVGQRHRPESVAPIWHRPARRDRPDPRGPLVGRNLEPAGDRPIRPGALRAIGARLPAGTGDQPLSFRGRGRHGAMRPAAGQPGDGIDVIPPSARVEPRTGRNSGQYPSLGAGTKAAAIGASFSLTAALFHASADRQTLV